MGFFKRPPNPVPYVLIRDQGTEIRIDNIVHVERTARVVIVTTCTYEPVTTVHPLIGATREIKTIYRILLSDFEEVQIVQENE